MITNEASAASAGAVEMAAAGEGRRRMTHMISQVFHALRTTKIEPALKPYDVTGVHYSILCVICERDGLSSAELSRRFHVTPQTMGQVLAGLDARKLITRREHPGNRRVLRISLTAAGRKIVDKCNREMDRIEHEVFGCIGAEDIDELHAKLHRIEMDLRASARSAAAVLAEPLPACANVVGRLG